MKYQFLITARVLKRTAYVGDPENKYLLETVSNSYESAELKARNHIKKEANCTDSEIDIYIIKIGRVWT